MNPSQLITDTKAKLGQATEHFKDELKKLRTGRAHPSMVDGLMVEVYGQPMPLKGVASITVPEPQQLQINPFDPGNLQAVAEAIRNDKSLGLTPVDDGRVVRVNLPPMTTENRQDMVKVLHQKLEESLISARNARHEALRAGEQSEKDKQISRDELERFKKQVDELLAKQKDEVEQLAKAKEQEILTV
ncbi:ribosome recycling factor [Candidatus Saccharibacteria bacterium]|nr:ribosome recycling factor [Candidatus Saccharibacteria bacterium]